MTSLRERFLDAEKKQKQSKKTYNQLDGLSGDLAVYAAALPKALEELMIRAEAGQIVSSTAYAPALRVVLKTPYYPPFSADYHGRREFPGNSEMLELQGYRKLLDTCADPAVDVCVRMVFSRPTTYRNELALTIDILINEGFANSTFYTQGPGRHDEHHPIGADYIAANHKPFKAPAVLKLSGTP